MQSIPLFFMKWGSDVVYYAYMSQDHLIKMKCEETGAIHYVTRKNKKQNPDPLVLSKYNPKNPQT